MPRKALIRSDFLPYHVTARVNIRESFHTSNDLAWKILTDELYLATLLFEIEIHAFVMMPNHFHLLVTAPKEDLGKAMSTYLIPGDCPAGVGDVSNSVLHHRIFAGT